jgi:hypothetical protein
VFVKDPTETEAVSSPSHVTPAGKEGATVAATD